MTDIARLIEKLEAATEGSITLDVELFHACGFGNSTQYPVREGRGLVSSWLTPTRSLEDAFRLFEVLHPRSEFAMAKSVETEMCAVRLWRQGQDEVETLHKGRHRSYSIAICIALLAASDGAQRAREAA